MGVLQNLNFSKAISELLPKLLGEALHIVVFVTLVGFFAAIVFGFILALGRVSKSKILNFPGIYSRNTVTCTDGIYLLCYAIVH